MPFYYFSKSESYHASHAIICTGDDTGGCGKMVKVEIDGHGDESAGRDAWRQATAAARLLAASLGWVEVKCPLHAKPKAP